MVVFCWLASNWSLQQVNVFCRRQSHGILLQSKKSTKKKKKKKRKGQ